MQRATEVDLKSQRAFYWLDLKNRNVYKDIDWRITILVVVILNVSEGSAQW